MAEISIIGSNVGSALNDMLMADEIVPGAQPGYNLCKLLYAYHPHGKKMAESPILMAMSQPRKISVPDAPDTVVKAFMDEWKAVGADDHITAVGTWARVYGIASIGIACEQYAPAQPIPYDKLADLDISFSVWDPLNTAGSLVLNQDPNAVDFQKHKGIAVNGVPWARNRTITLMHERPIYILFTSSAFGFVGRSVYQRALFPMKTFIQSMRTDDLVVIKCGVFIAKMKQAGSIITNAMQWMFGLKREVVKEATTGSVISIAPEESIETLNMQNLDGAFGLARKDTIENEAAAADMPAIILNSETFAEGFGEGSEDAKYVAKFVDGIRDWLEPPHQFFDTICQYRAWNRKFYETVQAQYPDRYKGVTYEEAFTSWCNNFTKEWPSLLTQPESEEAEKDKIKYEAAVAVAEVLIPIADPQNRANIAVWLANNLNDAKRLFTHPLILDEDALAAYMPPTGAVGEDTEPQEPKPFSRTA